MNELNYPKRSMLVLKPLNLYGNPEDEIEVIEFENENGGLEQMYKVIGCSYVDHFNIPELERNHIDIWLNDDGVLEALKPNIVLLNNDMRYCNELKGTLVFTKFTDEGDTIGLKRKDVEFIKKWIDERLKPSFDTDGRMFRVYQYDYDYIKECNDWKKEMEKLGFAFI